MIRDELLAVRGRHASAACGDRAVPRNGRHAAHSPKLITRRSTARPGKSRGRACRSTSASHASTIWHPVGTCKMGHDRMAVVDPQLRVHGVAACASPTARSCRRIVSANPNAAIIMIGEKAADLIKNTPLPSGEVASHRAGVGNDAANERSPHRSIARCLFRRERRITDKSLHNPTTEIKQCSKPLLPTWH